MSRGVSYENINFIDGVRGTSFTRSRLGVEIRVYTTRYMCFICIRRVLGVYETSIEPINHNYMELAFIEPAKTTTLSITRLATNANENRRYFSKGFFPLPLQCSTMRYDRGLKGCGFFSSYSYVIHTVLPVFV